MLKYQIVQKEAKMHGYEDINVYLSEKLKTIRGIHETYLKSYDKVKIT